MNFSKPFTRFPALLPCVWLVWEQSKTNGPNGKSFRFKLSSDSITYTLIMTGIKQSNDRSSLVQTIANLNDERSSSTLYILNFHGIRWMKNSGVTIDSSWLTCETFISMQCLWDVSILAIIAGTTRFRCVRRPFFRIKLIYLKMIQFWIVGWLNNSWIEMTVCYVVLVCKCCNKYSVNGTNKSAISHGFDSLTKSRTKRDDFAFLTRKLKIVDWFWRFYSLYF